MTLIRPAVGALPFPLRLACLLMLACILPLAAQAQTAEPAPAVASVAAEAEPFPQPVLQPGTEPPAEKTQFDITVRLTGGEPATGTVEISLFNSSENFLVQPYLQTSGPINEDGTYTTRFGKVPAGEYAVVVVHDENDNGKLDTGFMGFGGETYAFSNDAKPLFGRPDFDEVKFRVDSDTRIRITLD